MENPTITVTPQIKELLLKWQGACREETARTQRELLCNVKCEYAYICKQLLKIIAPKTPTHPSQIC